jgi:outer membrane protein OmpA-like peptidoglycan-associated protein
MKAFYLTPILALAMLSACAETDITQHPPRGLKNYQDEATVRDAAASKNTSYNFDTPVVFESIYFEYGHSELSDADKKMLRALFDKSISLADYEFVVVGNADESGPSERSVILAGERGEAVGNYLIEIGAPIYKVFKQTEGTKNPAVIGVTPYGLDKNRRAEVYLIPKS